MSTSPVFLPVEQLGARPFSFYPPIRNVACNEWRCRRVTWAEVVAVNTGSGEEVCVPRSFVGDVSMGYSGIVVDLMHEMEQKAGGIVQHKCPVIEFPVSDMDTGANRGKGSAPVVSIRLEQRTEARGGRKIGVAIMLGAVVCAAGADVARTAQARDRMEAFELSRGYLQLNAADDYASVVQKLGPPVNERGYTDESGRVYRLLAYPKRRFVVVLSGASNADARYSGALDSRGRASASP